MQARRWLGLALLLGVGLGVSASAQSPGRGDDLPLMKRLARDAKVTEEQAKRVFEVLGPVVRDELKKGRVVNVPGLGTFRVVQVAEHKDIERGTGRVMRIPATNRVEFTPDGSLNQAANSPGAVPQDTVPAFEYIPLPDRAEGQKSGATRSTGTKIR